MKLQNLAHASYLITAKNGTKVITDPICPESHAAVPLKPGVFDETADVLAITHEHHCWVFSVKGEPQVYVGQRPVEIKGVKFNGIATYHDDHQGKLLGPNTIICIEADGVRVCHLGDLGHILSDEQLKQIGRVDILLIAVFGEPMMSLKYCNTVCDQLKAKVVIPVHYWLDEIPAPAVQPGVEPLFKVENMFTVKDFLKDKKNVIWMDTSELEYTPETLPQETQYILPKAKYYEYQI